MSLQLPEGMDPSMLGAPAQGLPQGMQPDQPDAQQSDPLAVLQECIQSLPGLLHALPDPQDVQDATQALLILTRIQTRVMGKQNAPQAG